MFYKLPLEIQTIEGACTSDTPYYVSRKKEHVCNSAKNVPSNFFYSPSTTYFFVIQNTCKEMQKKTRLEYERVDSYWQRRMIVDTLYSKLISRKSAAHVRRKVWKSRGVAHSVPEK